MRIREIRVERGLTQAAVAEAVGVTGPAVWKWEQGKAAPSYVNLLALAALFGRSLNALAGETAPDDPPSKAAS